MPKKDLFLKTFKNFNLPAQIQKALEKIQFSQPTPIQSQAIPVALERKDLIGCAQTGTGKTGAFSIPTLNHLLSHPNEIALVLVPTRELALQVEEFWKKITSFCPQIQSVTLMGGVPFGSQLRALKKSPRLIIATPGRLVDHLERRNVRLNHAKTLILDEADRMLDMGFLPQLSKILEALPKDRQTLLFSATWEKEVDKLSQRFVRSPERVTAGTVSQAAPKISQSMLEITQQKKNEALLDELNRREGSILVFARTQVRTDRLARYLHSYGFDVNRLHGGRTQFQRTSALNAFRDGKVRILIATDIAARGIDISEISHVINYDLPQSPEDYIHRIGRTGRAGAVGSALSLVTPEDRSQWRQITRLLQKSGSKLPSSQGITQAKGSVKAPQGLV